MTRQWVNREVPLAAGLLTKGDVRAGEPPFLDIARDVQFDEQGGVQPRLPFGVLGNNIFGGGTLTNCRRLAVVNNELCVFTDVAMFSWNAQLSAWVSRGTHLAVSVDETPRFSTTGDQQDGDRAELAGTMVFAWTEGTQVFAAAQDKTTGSVLVATTAVSTAIGRPRLVALATKILLFVQSTATEITVRAIDPAAPGTAISGAGTVVLTTNANLFYDVVRAGTQDLCVGVIRRVVTTSYTVFSCTPGLTITAVTKARTADGPVAVATIPDGTQTQVIRANGTNIQGDLLTTSTLADVFTGQAIGTAAGTPVNQIAVEFASVLVGGQFQATAFWSAQEVAGDTGFSTKVNTVNTANAIGAQAQLIAWLGVASRAFDFAGAIYVWLAFAGDSSVTGTGTTVGVRAQLQNTYFLYRADGFLVAKCTDEVGGGFSPSTGHLPGVALTGTATYSWCSTSRRIIPIGNDGERTGYAARSPHDITFSFDSNEARRSAQIGATLYIGGGLVLQYDGAALTELGFQIYPWAFATAPIGGAIAAGTYVYKCTWRWSNAQDEQERSTTATGGSVTYGVASKGAIAIAALTVTRKTGAVRAVAAEVWRTAIAPNVDSPFFLTTSKDPNAVGDNGYVANNAASGGFLTTFNDNFTDATLITKEPNPENGSDLESLTPPGAKLVIATDTRVFLGDVAGDPDAVWPSRLRRQGEIASFHDGLRVLVPRQGGRMTALAFNNETLTVFRQTAIYALPGDGFNNAGQGQNFGPARIISLDVGAVSQESVALTPLGTIFKSSKGWYLLTPSWQVMYIGAPVNAFDADTVRAVNVVETQHHVRILTSSRMLIWDYLQNPYGTEIIGQWGEWTIEDGIHAVIWQGRHVYLTATGPKIQATGFGTATYGLDAETAWIKTAGMQGDAKVRAFSILGEWRSAFLGRIRVARDYQYDGAGNPAYYDDLPWTPDTALVGNALQVRHSPSQPTCQAIKVRFSAVTAGTPATLNTTNLVAQVTTSGTIWQATLTPDTLPGNAGNVVTLSIAFDNVAGAFAIDVNDHFTWSQSLQRWREDVNNVGVRVRCNAGSRPTVAQLEAAINAGSTIASVTVADATPGKTVSAAMIGTAVTGLFTGGAYGVPSGEACKLTSLVLEIGTKPGITRRLSAEQKVG